MGQDLWSPVGHPKAPSPGFTLPFGQGQPWSQGRWWLVRPGEPGMSLTVSLVLSLMEWVGAGKSTGQGF